MLDKPGWVSRARPVRVISAGLLFGADATQITAERQTAFTCARTSHGMSGV